MKTLRTGIDTGCMPWALATIASKGTCGYPACPSTPPQLEDSK